MSIETDVNYMEGKWGARAMLKHIDDTEYGTIENAIVSKQKLIENFEKDFGHTREDYKDDRNYSYNCGLLDGLTELLTNQNKNDEEIL